MDNIINDYIKKMEVRMVKLGDEVIDKVSGFVGVAIADTKYLQGCNKITVQPVVKEDGSLPDSQAFDKPQLRIVKKKKVKKGDDGPGGVAYAQPSEKKVAMK